MQGERIEGKEKTVRGVFLSTVIAFVSGLGVLLAGCSQPGSKSSPKADPPSSASPQKPAETPKAAEPKQADAGAKALPEGLAELPEADRALAQKQKVCPVSGEPLGSMGKPVKVEIKGRTVFLCCGGCEADLKKDPDKYLAKLDAAGQK
jgi:YHS domain-containing protein